MSQGFRISTNIAAESSNTSKRVVFTARDNDDDGFVSWNAPLSYKCVTVFKGGRSGMAGVAFAIPLFSWIGNAIPHF